MLSMRRREDDFYEDRVDFPRDIRPPVPAPIREKEFVGCNADFHCPRKHYWTASEYEGEVCKPCIFLRKANEEAKNL